MTLKRNLPHGQISLSLRFLKDNDRLPCEMQSRAQRCQALCQHLVARRDSGGMELFDFFLHFCIDCSSMEYQISGNSIPNPFPIPSSSHLTLTLHELKNGLILV